MLRFGAFGARRVERGLRVVYARSRLGDRRRQLLTLLVNADASRWPVSVWGQKTE